MTKLINLFHVVLKCISRTPVLCKTMYAAQMHWASCQQRELVVRVDGGEDRSWGGRRLSHQDLHNEQISFYSFPMRHALRGGVELCLWKKWGSYPYLWMLTRRNHKKIPGACNKLLLSGKQGFKQS